MFDYTTIYQLHTILMCPFLQICGMPEEIAMNGAPHHQNAINKKIQQIVKTTITQIESMLTLQGDPSPRGLTDQLLFLTCVKMWVTMSP